MKMSFRTARKTRLFSSVTQLNTSPQDNLFERFQKLFCISVFLLSWLFGSTFHSSVYIVVVKTVQIFKIK